MTVQYQQQTIMTRLKDEYSVKIDKVCVGRRSGTDVSNIQFSQRSLGFISCGKPIGVDCCDLFLNLTN